MLALERLEKRELLAVTVSISNIETIQVDNADQVEVSQPNYGTLSPVDNSLQYDWSSPPVDDSFTYIDKTTQENVSVELIADKLPKVNPDVYYTPDSSALVVKAVDGVLANDFYVANMDVVVLSSPINGRLLMKQDGGFNYKPDKNFSGVDTFEYTVSDGVTTVPSTSVAVHVIDASQYYGYALEEASALKRKENAHVLPLYNDFYMRTI